MSNFFKKARMELSLTQGDVGAMTGIQVSAISRMETHGNMPSSSAETRSRLAAAYGVDVSAIEFEAQKIRDAFIMDAEVEESTDRIMDACEEIEKGGAR